MVTIAAAAVVVVVFIVVFIVMLLLSPMMVIITMMMRRTMTTTENTLGLPKSEGQLPDIDHPLSIDSGFGSPSTQKQPLNSERLHVSRTMFLFDSKVTT